MRRRACGGGRAAVGVRRQHARFHARMCACAGGEEARRHDRRASRALRVGLVETRERRPSVVPPPVECRAVVGRAAADVVRLGRLQTRICSSPVFRLQTSSRHSTCGAGAELAAARRVCLARVLPHYPERRGRAVPSTCQHGVCVPSLPPAPLGAGAIARLDPCRLLPVYPPDREIHTTAGRSARCAPRRPRLGPRGPNRPPAPPGVWDWAVAPPTFGPRLVRAASSCRMRPRRQSSSRARADRRSSPGSRRS